MARRSTPDDEGLFAPAQRAPFTPHIVAGIDEAGLGPLLGPFTLGWAAFRADNPACLEDLWTTLAPAVSRVPTAMDALAVADSKEVYTRTPRGAQRLERVVRAFDHLYGLLDTPAQPSAGNEWFRQAAGVRWNEALAEEYWWSDTPHSLCNTDDAEAQHLLATRLRACAAQQSLTLVAQGVRTMTARELNASYARTDSKSATLWEEVLALIQLLWYAHAYEGLALTIDRQGARSRYAGLLAAVSPDVQVTVLRETSSDALYRLDDDHGRRALIRCVERAESLSLPVALASCRAKYARELAMEGFNRCFARHAPAVQPTAGYVEDGRRWLAEMQPTLQRLGLDPSHIVRSR